MVQLQLAPDNDAEDKAEAENFSWGKASGAENQRKAKEKCKGNEQQVRNRSPGYPQTLPSI